MIFKTYIAKLLLPFASTESPINYGLTDEHVGALEKLTMLTALLIKVRGMHASDACTCLCRRACFLPPIMALRI